MNFTKAYQDELNTGKEPDPTKPLEDKSNALEARVEHIHNDWIKHQCTQDLVNGIKLEYERAVFQATVSTVKGEDQYIIRNSLMAARTFDKVLLIITNYGKLNND